MDRVVARVSAGWRLAGLATAALASTLLIACAPHSGGAWNTHSAAAYLDRRESWWAGWSHAARERHTFCVSCHTSIPYALARPALTRVLDESPDSVRVEQQLVADVTRRVRLWSTVRPYYPDQAVASRGTEAVLNAVVLVAADSHDDRLSPDTQLALREMWALQEGAGASAGAWPWIEFNNEPWEAYDSAYYGAALAALAVGMAPADYRDRPEIQTGLARLRDYLNRAFASQSTLNRVDALWASTYVPGLLDPANRAAVIREVWSKQRADGGWCVAQVVGNWARHDGTREPMQSDGYATGLIALALERSGVPRTDPRLAHALAWLIAQQHPWSGGWNAASLNKRRNWLLDRAAPFMDDAATGFAVLALTDRPPAERRLAQSGAAR